MMLIGMLDSPFVRRVAVSMTLLELPFERLDWSVGRDFARIQEYNPLGRVPTLVLPDGEALLESSAILDYLDDQVGPARALLPASGSARRAALRVMAIASGAAEKSVLQVYESVFRPAEKRHEPWLARCRSQVRAAFAELEALCQKRAGEWLIGPHLTQADVTVACIVTFTGEALGDAAAAAASFPALHALTQRCEALSAFQAQRAPFFVPRPQAGGA